MTPYFHSFLELSSTSELVDLCTNAAPAWVWSADGSHILWANAAGAEFFSAKSLEDLEGKDGFFRSPARPFIERIATSGSSERATIERLRFYRGLRVLLLTCQCRRISLSDGSNAALIICVDAVHALQSDPLKGYAELLSSSDRTAFVQVGSDIDFRRGALSGQPEVLEMPDGQSLLIGPVEVDGAFHDGAVLSFDADTRLLVLEDEPLEDVSLMQGGDDLDDEPTDDVTVETAPAETVTASPEEERDLTLDIAEEPAQPVVTEFEPVSPPEDAPSQIDLETAIAEADAQDIELYETDDAAEEVKPAEAEALPTADLSSAAFVFQPSRRPIRFAWQMDIEQRFTFISEEFGETLGPRAADVVGMTWQEVASRFHVDETGSIGRALDRRDTWSGKTINWPVDGLARRVPVDMAALPAFDRNREFEGYRGFGVCRSADAIEDPEAPLALATAVAPAAMAVVEEALSEEAQAEEAVSVSQAEVTETAFDTAPDASAASTPDEDVVEPEDAAAFDIVEDAPIQEEERAEDVPSETAPTADADTSEEEAEPTAHQAEEIDLTPLKAEPLEGGTLLATSITALVGGIAAAKTSDSTSERFTAHGFSDQTDAHSAPADLSNATEAVAAESEDDVSEPVEVTETAEQEEDTIAPASEPTGISGSAPLEPKEIESAVKTLAADYNRKRTAEAKRPAELLKELEDTPSDEEEPIASNDAEVTPEPSSIDANLPTADSDDEATLDFAHEATEEKVAKDEAKDTVEEEEFFQETAAFRQEDLDAAAEDSERELEHLGARFADADDDAPTAEDDVIEEFSNIFPIDTSKLTKPERAAFLTIAEALGATFEGDFDAQAHAVMNDNFAVSEIEAVPAAESIDPGLLDRLPIGIAIVHDRDVLYANDTLLDLLGYPNQRTLSEAGGLEAIFVEDDEDATLPDAEGMEGTVDGLLKVRLVNGGVLPVDARMHSVPWNGGSGLMISIMERVVKPNGAVNTPASAPLVETSVSTAELEEAQAIIAEQDTILETATDGVLMLDRYGTIIKVNRSAEALFSASRSDMVGAPLNDYLAPESHRAAGDYLDGLSKNGVASILNDGREVLGRVSSGGLIPLFMTIGRLSGTGEEPKFCAVLRDITQWKAAEEELTQAKRQAEQSNSQKSDFLAKISHEIRTPLNAIIGFSEVMMEERFGTIGNDRYKEYLKDIRTSGSHIMSLINDLLDLSKIEAGKMDLKFIAVSPNDVVNECVALMQPQANRERIIIRASLPESVPDIVADQRSLRQIVLNLLSNAIKFNKPGGQVIVSSSMEDNGEVVLRIRDTGTGMNTKDLAAALEPFRQVHTARHGGGTGLGLPLTKALVEANRAGFHIDSTPDEGTLVEVRFPSQRVLAE